MFREFRAAFPKQPVIWAFEKNYRTIDCNNYVYPKLLFVKKTVFRLLNRTYLTFVK